MIQAKNCRFLEETANFASCLICKTFRGLPNHYESGCPSTKDMLDIEAVIAVQDELDFGRIRFWVQ